MRAPGIAGARLLVVGVVRDRTCRPLAGARIDVWQTDGNGVYDLTGDRLRATFRVDVDGRYELRTVAPAPYRDGELLRPAHIHFRVYDGDAVALTTQLYFAGDPNLARDPFVRDELVAAVVDGRAAFDLTV